MKNATPPSYLNSTIAKVSDDDLLAALKKVRDKNKAIRDSYLTLEKIRIVCR